MKKTSLGIIFGTAVCIAAGAWYFMQQAAAPAAGKGSAKAGGQAPVVVNVVTPQRQDVPVLLQANGSVTPMRSVDLHPQTTAAITTVHIGEGQFVKAGELMFSLDARSAHAGVDKARAQLMRDQASLADLERQQRRAQELLSKNFIAQGAVDTLNSQVESARALLGADRAALRAAQVDASYATIRAPMAGRVGAIAVYPGSLVQLSTSLTTITQLDPINVAFTLPEAHLADLLAAHKAGAVPVKVAAAGAGAQVEGKLSFIDNTVDPGAGVIRLKARFGNPDSRLWPGQYVSTSLAVRTLKDVLVIPQNAIINNSSGTFVYTVEADQSVKARPVVRLHAFGAQAAVSGLSGNEKVVLEGKQNLRPGASVRLAEASPASAANKKAGQR